uniref:Uncharacterized protein n=1 Tax=Rhizophora mucronata TaxID=61149 RepID=A0A2P2NMN1_RHIMU
MLSVLIELTRSSKIPDLFMFGCWLLHEQLSFLSCGEKAKLFVRLCQHLNFYFVREFLTNDFCFR